MDSITALNVSGRVARIFPASEFMNFDECYGIDYRFPQLTQRSSLSSCNPVLQSEVEGMTLSYGIYVIHSDARVLQPYETTSRHDSPLYVPAMLEGCMLLMLNGQEHVVRPGMAFNSCLSEHQTMRAHHHADCKLWVLSLGLYPDGVCHTGLLESLMCEWERCQTPMLIWQVSGFLPGRLQHAQQGTINHVSRQLILEGLILQLFGHGLNVCQVKGGKRLATSGEQQQLEAARRLLKQGPGNDYTPNDLTRRATMSPSSLCSKFRAVYGCSVFDYLRDYRLGRTRGYLLEGYNAQQVTWISGYQHATNFPIVFRRRYGFSSDDLFKPC